MQIPFVIENDQHRLGDVLNSLLAESSGKPLDIATAYFSVSGYRLVKDGLHAVGAFRLLLGWSAGAQATSPSRSQGLCRRNGATAIAQRVLPACSSPVCALPLPKITTRAQCSIDPRRNSRL